jgi:beta-N-acetylhexosaminidase
MAADPLAGLILAGFEGTHINDPGVQALLDLEVGGFILFGRNVESPEQVRALLAGLRKASSGRAVFFAVDQEGGRVARLRSPLTVWPPMAELGRLGDEEKAESVGQALASEISALGFNLVFAPVLDVRFDGTTDAIGDRSLGADSKRVSSLGSALVRGIQSTGLIACAKHFPGHGHVTVDSHLTLPVCPLSRAELMAKHVPPFRAASETGVGSVMTAHVRYPEVDPEQPATFSRTWLHDILRTEVGFEGLVLTDDLEMGAVTGSGRVADAAVRAVQAGADGLLICKDIEAIRESVRALRAAADDDLEFLAACVDSLARLQAAASIHPPEALGPEQLSERLGPAAHQLLAQSLRSDELRVGFDPTEPSAPKSPDQAGTS